MPWCAPNGVIFWLRVSKQDEAQKALAYAFLLLKFRQRSAKEIRRRLERKKFSPEIISATVSFLRGKNFVDDRAFAAAWVSSRLKRPFGLRRIRRELELKGVDREIIEESLEAAGEDFREDEVVAEIARQRFEKLKGMEPARQRRL